MEVGPGKVAGEVARTVAVADAQGGRGAGVGDGAGAVEDVDGVGAGGHRAHADSVKVKGGALTDDKVDVGCPEQARSGKPQRAFIDAHRTDIGDGVGGAKNEHPGAALGQAGGAGDQRGVDREGVACAFHPDGEIVAGRRRNERGSPADGTAASGEQDAGAGRGSDGEGLTGGQGQIVGAGDLKGVDRGGGLGGDGPGDAVVAACGQSGRSAGRVHEAGISAVNRRTQGGARPRVGKIGSVEIDARTDEP